MAWTRESTVRWTPSEVQAAADNGPLAAADMIHARSNQAGAACQRLAVDWANGRMGLTWDRKNRTQNQMIALMYALRDEASDIYRDRG